MQIILDLLVNSPLVSDRVSYANNIRSVSCQPVNELVSYANTIRSVSYRPVNELVSYANNISFF